MKSKPSTFYFLNVNDVFFCNSSSWSVRNICGHNVTIPNIYLRICKKLFPGLFLICDDLKVPFVLIELYGSVSLAHGAWDRFRGTIAGIGRHIIRGDLLLCRDMEVLLYPVGFQFAAEQVLFVRDFACPIAVAAAEEDGHMMRKSEILVILSMNIKGSCM